MSLLRTAARVGVASSVHGRVQRRQRERWAAQDAQTQTPPPPPPAPPAPSGPGTQEKIDLLKQLGELRDAGVLTDTEFEVKKAEVLRA